MTSIDWLRFLTVLESPTSFGDELFGVNASTYASIVDMIFTKLGTIISLDLTYGFFRDFYFSALKVWDSLDTAARISIVSSYSDLKNALSSTSDLNAGKINQLQGFEPFMLRTT